MAARISAFGLRLFLATRHSPLVTAFGVYHARVRPSPSRAPLPAFPPSHFACVSPLVTAFVNWFIFLPEATDNRSGGVWAARLIVSVHGCPHFDLCLFLATRHSPLVTAFEVRHAGDGARPSLRQAQGRLWPWSKPARASPVPPLSNVACRAFILSPLDVILSPFAAAQGKLLEGPRQFADVGEQSELWGFFAQNAGSE